MTTANGLITGTTLITAVGVPTYVQSVLGAEWLNGLPGLAQLLATNTVVLAVIMAIGSNPQDPCPVPAGVLQRPANHGSDRNRLQSPADNDRKR